VEIISDSGDDINSYVIAGFNFLLEDNVTACVVQTLMQANWKYSGSQITIDPVTSEGEQIGYEYCTTPQTSYPTAPSIVGQVASDMTIQGQTEDGCCNFIYYNS